MKTLKEELQEIVSQKKLNEDGYFICWHLSNHNRSEFCKYKEMASNYAKKHFMGGGAWWYHVELKAILKHIISEKYRFIRDLIKILP